MVALLDIVTAYLDSPDTDYAIMIDGPWGSGKTFFWKNQIAPMLTGRNNTEGRALRSAYVSLYGITRPEEIHQEVFFALHPLLRNKFSKVATGAVGLVAKRLGFD